MTTPPAKTCSETQVYPAGGVQAAEPTTTLPTSKALASARH